MLTWPRRTIHIQAPSQQVFDFINHPKYQHEYWPNVVEISDFILQPNGGYHYRFVYKFAGRLVHIAARLTEYRPGQYFTHVFSNHHVDLGQSSWMFTPDAQGTLVSCTCQGMIPPEMQDWAPEAIVARNVGREMELALDQIKRRLENKDIWTLLDNLIDTTFEGGS